MATVRISCPRRFLDSFRAAAIARAPREVYAVLLGRRRGRQYWVRDIWFPEGLRSTTYSTEYVLTTPRVMSDAQAVADSTGLQIIGDIHSHPWTVTRADFYKTGGDSPSGEDWRRPLPPHWIQGICTVNQAGKRRPRYVTAIKFWPSLPKVEVSFT